MQLGELVPGGELAQQAGVLVVAAAGQTLSGPAFEQQDLSVDGGQGAAGHEQVAQVRGGPRAVQAVQAVVGERELVAGEGAQTVRQARGLLRSQFSARSGLGVASRLSASGCSSGRMRPVPSSSSSASRACSRTRVRVKGRPG